MNNHYGQKIRDWPCQSNFDKLLSDFGSFLVIYIIILLWIVLVFLTQTLLEIEIFIFFYRIWLSKKGVSQDTLTLIEVCI